MKYYLAETGTIDGPGNKPLSIVLEKKRVSETEFNECIDKFFADSDTTDEAKSDGRKKLFDYLNRGKSVTVGDKTLTIKK